MTVVFASHTKPYICQSSETRPAVKDIREDGRDGSSRREKRMAIVALKGDCIGKSAFCQNLVVSGTHTAAGLAFVFPGAHVEMRISISHGMEWSLTLFLVPSLVLWEAKRSRGRLGSKSLLPSFRSAGGEGHPFLASARTREPPRTGHKKETKREGEGAAPQPNAVLLLIRSISVCFDCDSILEQACGPVPPELSPQSTHIQPRDRENRHDAQAVVAVVVPWCVCRLGFTAWRLVVGDVIGRHVNLSV